MSTICRSESDALHFRCRRTIGQRSAMEFTDQAFNSDKDNRSGIVAGQEIEQGTGEGNGPAALAGPAKVGSELRAVREQLGWSLADLSARLKIRRALLDAIEAGDLAALPAPAYAAGFIRNYAEALGLDPEEILRRFRAEGMTPPKEPKLNFPEPVPDRAVPPGALALVALVIAVGGYFLWYQHSEHQIHLADAVPPVPTKLAPLAVPKSELPTPAKSVPSSRPRTATPGLAAKARVAETPPVSTDLQPPKPLSGATTVPSPAANPAASTEIPAAGGANPVQGPPTKSGSTVAANAVGGVATQSLNSSDAARAVAGLPKPAGVSHAGPTSSDVASSVGTASSSTTVPPIDSSPLVVSATSKSWVQIRDAKGKILFSQVLKAGEGWPVPNEPGITLTTGNAGGTIVVRNGHAGPPLGPPGVVLRHVLLTGVQKPAATGQVSPSAILTNSIRTPTSPGGAVSVGTPVPSSKTPVSGQ